MVVAWDEAGEPDFVERTTFAYDPAELEQYFPTAEGALGEEKAGTPEEEMEKVRRLAPPELKAGMPPPAKPAPTGRPGRARR